MNILLMGEKQDTRRILQLLLEKSKHRLERKSLESFPEPDLEAYDMVLVDGAVQDCTQQVNLLQWIREARRRYPHLPVAVMNNVGSDVAPDVSSNQYKASSEPLHTCGVFESGNGVLNMRCRLQEIALGETAALMRDECERPVLEPITFEYSGRG
jgi:DNA-binding NtrC family response regulator